MPTNNDFTCVYLKCSSQGKSAALTFCEHLGVRLLCSGQYIDLPQVAATTLQLVASCRNGLHFWKDVLHYTYLHAMDTSHAYNHECACTLCLQACQSRPLSFTRRCLLLAVRCIMFNTYATLSTCMQCLLLSWCTLNFLTACTFTSSCTKPRSCYSDLHLKLAKRNANQYYIFAQVIPPAKRFLSLKGIRTLYISNAIHSDPGIRPVAKARRSLAHHCSYDTLCAKRRLFNHVHGCILFTQLALKMYIRWQGHTLTWLLFPPAKIGEVLFMGPLCHCLPEIW